MELIREALSNHNNRIQLYKVESESFKKTILFIGVFHGDEPEGEFLVQNLMTEVKSNTELIKNKRILFIPVLNPDGKELKTRGNSNGVDLNRNFPTQNWEQSREKDSYYSGKSPVSEVETRFLVDVIEEYNLGLIVTLHTPYRVVNYDGPAKEVAELISTYTSYPVQEDIGYPTPGSFGTYAGIERNIPTITLELPENVELNKLWSENKQALIEVIKFQSRLELSSVK